MANALESAFMYYIPEFFFSPIMAACFGEYEHCLDILEPIITLPGECRAEKLSLCD